MRGTKKETQPCRKIGDLNNLVQGPAGDAVSVERDFDSDEKSEDQECSPHRGLHNIHIGRHARQPRMTQVLNIIPNSLASAILASNIIITQWNEEERRGT